MDFPQTNTIFPCKLRKFVDIKINFLNTMFIFAQLWRIQRIPWSSDENLETTKNMLSKIQFPALMMNFQQRSFTISVCFCTTFVKCALSHPTNTVDEESFYVALWLNTRNPNVYVDQTSAKTKDQLLDTLIHGYSFYWLHAIW